MVYCEVCVALLPLSIILQGRNNDMEEVQAEEMRGIGYLFTLKKHMQYKNTEENVKDSFITFGYYNDLNITKVNQWYQLRPRGMEELGVINSLEALYFDQYTIKTLIPQNKGSLEKKGFDYETWNNLAEYSKKYPYVSMVTIHLSQMFIAKEKNVKYMTSLLAEEIRKTAKKKGIVEFSELHCAIFPSIGYLDFVVVFLTNQFSPIGKIINGLRIWKYKGTPALSSCYTVCGMARNYGGRVDDEGDKDFTLSIKVSLKEGISAQEFYSELIKELSKRLKMESEQIEEVKEKLREDIITSVTFGNSDCLLSPKFRLYGYLKQYLKDGIFNINSDFYKTYIEDIRSTIGIREINGNDEEKNEKKLRNNENKLEQAYENKKFKYDDFIQKLEHFFDEKHMSIRPAKAIQKTITNYLNLAYSSHGFDVRGIFEPFIDAVINNVIQIIDLKSEDITEDDRDMLYQEMLVALRFFRSIVGDYLLDLIRSDKPFIEGNILVHTSIGAATKLLFSYNILLRELAKKIQWDGAKDEIEFIVTSGGTDTIVSRDLFDFYTETSIKPIIIVMPEMSLYDFKGTLFRLFHECMHFCGNRKRPERFKLFVQHIANFISDDFANLLYLHKDRAKNLCEHLDKYCRESVYGRIIDEIQVILNHEAQVVKTKIYKYIMGMDLFRLERFEGKEGDREFYIRELFGEEGRLNPQSLLNKIVLDKKFKEFLYNLLFEKELLLAEKVLDVVSEKSDLHFRSYLNRERILAWRDKCDKYLPLEGTIDLYWQCFLDDTNLTTKLDVNVIPYVERIEDLISICQECYSDVRAARVLGMKAEDFLLAFIYDKKELNQAMPDTVLNALRMRVDLKVLYNITEELDDGLKDKLYEKIDHWKNRGFEYDQIDEYVTRINDLLKMDVHIKSRLMMEPVEQYLNKCCKGVGTFNIHEIFQKCDLDEFRDLYKVIEFLVGKWKGIAIDEK